MQFRTKPKDTNDAVQNNSFVMINVRIMYIIHTFMVTMTKLLRKLQNKRKETNDD